MDFWRGQAVLRYENRMETVEVRVFVDHDFDLKIGLPNDLGLEALFLIQQQDITVEIPESGPPIPVFLSHFSSSVSEGEQVVFTPKRTPLWRSGDVPLRRGTSALLNFTGFDVGPPTRNRMLLSACGWLLTVTPVHETLVCFPKLIAGEEHVVTHALEFERENGTLFSREEMLLFLENLGQFFSFCHGGWVGISLSVGQDENGVAALEEWGHGRLGPPSNPDGWLDRHHLECMVELYPLYMQKVTDEDWADAFGHVVYWLQRSEVENAGPDGGIILLQAALERFAWHLLVRDGGAISGQGFEKLTAADQIRLMISHLKLPRQVPTGLKDLAKYALANGLDAPEAITRVRNRVVHPPKLTGKQEKLHYYEAYKLGRWYAELTVLASCGYNSLYRNSTNDGSWVGQVEQVPWTR